MRSIPPADYAGLPALRHPAAYICVMRDIDSGRYQIQSTDYPRSFVEAASGERAREFGLELLAILESDNIAESEARLYQRHHAALSEEWLELDMHQLRELQRSLLQVSAYRSHYISPDQTHSPERLRPTEAALPIQQAHAKAAAAGNRLDKSRSSIPLVAPGSSRNGAHALGRYAGNKSAATADTRASKRSIRQAIDDATTDFMTNHPGKCLVALALMVLFSLTLHNHYCPGLQRNCMDTRSASTGVPVQPAPSTQRSAGTSGPSYTVVRAVDVRALAPRSLAQGSAACHPEQRFARWARSRAGATNGFGSGKTARSYTSRAVTRP